MAAVSSSAWKDFTNVVGAPMERTLAALMGTIDNHGCRNFFRLIAIKKPINPMESRGKVQGGGKGMPLNEIEREATTTRNGRKRKLKTIESNPKYKAAFLD